MSYITLAVCMPNIHFVPWQIGQLQLRLSYGMVIYIYIQVDYAFTIELHVNIHTLHKLQHGDTIVGCHPSLTSHYVL